MTRGLLIIGLLAVLVGCLALVGLVNQMTGDAVSRALNENSAPGNAQRVTAVCVGLNIGSCRTNQQSTSTTRPASDDGDGLPWPVKLLAVAVLCPLLLGGMVWAVSRTEEW